MNYMQKKSPAELYEEYLVPGVHDRWTPLLLEHAKPQPGEHVLDLACGTGVVARRIAPLVGSEGLIVGVDISPDMLAVTERCLRRLGKAMRTAAVRSIFTMTMTLDRRIVSVGSLFYSPSGKPKGHGVVGLNNVMAAAHHIWVPGIEPGKLTNCVFLMGATFHRVLESVPVGRHLHARE
jgi:SAM-dependent methyltransferase